jgi:hypothetical protein
VAVVIAVASLCRGVPAQMETAEASCLGGTVLRSDATLAAASSRSCRARGGTQAVASASTRATLRNAGGERDGAGLIDAHDTSCSM